MATLKIVPDKLDIVLCPGASLALSGELRDDPEEPADCETPGALVDTSGYSGKIRFKASANSTESLGEVALAFGGANGVVSILVTDAFASALPSAAKFLDIFVTDADGNVIPVAAGKFTRGFE